MTTYSQLRQDLAVVEFYKSKRNGYYLEIGASNGIRLSNTYLLEKDYDWKGICVEPLPSCFEQLQKNRPNSICVNKAVYNTSGQTVKFSISHRCDLLSGISEHLTCHKERVDQNKTDIEVKTITFNDLLVENNAPEFIDYLSLDTEGTELMILQSVDHTKFTFGLIDVEHNYQPIRKEIRTFLESKGYVYKKANSFDDSYLHKSLV